MRCYLFSPSFPLAALAFVTFLTYETPVAGDAASQTIINVDVYYEALCPDSINFITKQLAPAYPMLKEHLNVTLIPYGKATQRKGENNAWKFSCQHGPPECYGNKAQACAINEIQLLEKPEDRQKLMVDVVNCAMSASNPSTAVPKCTQQIGLNDEMQKKIEDCTSSTLSDDLLAANGDKTHALSPPLAFVPTVIINNTPNQDVQTSALRNFSKLICDMLPQNERPTGCDKKQ